MSSEQVVFGYHAVRALLRAHPSLVKQIIFADNRKDQRLQELLTYAKKCNVKPVYLATKDFDRYVQQDQVHQGVVAICSSLPSYTESDIEMLIEGDKPALILILDGIQDPHNLGACLRSANAFAVDCVIAPKNNSASINATVAKVACGAAVLTPFIQVTNLARTIKRLQQLGIWLVGLDADTEQPLRALDLTGSIGLVMGSEGSGMRRLTQQNCDFLAHINMPGEVASLNVSVATGISLYEVLRQRG